jgi:hypothetical protein
MSERNPDAAPEPGSREHLVRRVDLGMADSLVAGWEKAVLYELRKMRRELPYASVLYLDLCWEAGPEVAGA